MASLPAACAGPAGSASLPRSTAAPRASPPSVSAQPDGAPAPGHMAARTDPRGSAPSALQPRLCPCPMPVAANRGPGPRSSAVGRTGLGGRPPRGLRRSYLLRARRREGEAPRTTATRARVTMVASPAGGPRPPNDRSSAAVPRAESDRSPRGARVLTPNGRRHLPPSHGLRRSQRARLAGSADSREGPASARRQRADMKEFDTEN